MGEGSFNRWCHPLSHRNSRRSTRPHINPLPINCHQDTQGIASVMVWVYRQHRSTVTYSRRCGTITTPSYHDCFPAFKTVIVFFKPGGSVHHRERSCDLCRTLFFPTASRGCLALVRSMKWIQTNELLGVVLPRVKKPGLLVSIPQPLEVTRRVRFCIPPSTIMAPIVGWIATKNFKCLELRWSSDATEKSSSILPELMTILLKFFDGSLDWDPCGCQAATHDLQLWASTWAMEEQIWKSNL